MGTARSEMTNPPRRLPEVTLPSETTGVATPMNRRGRVAPIVILVHGGPCERCTDFLRQLDQAHEAITEWDGRLLAVRSGQGAQRSAPLVDGLKFQVLLDPEARFASRLSLEAPAVVIADQYGEVHVAEVAGEGHDFITPPEIADWAKFLAIQCPECQGEAL